jgi:hypothetical protein
VLPGKALVRALALATLVATLGGCTSYDLANAPSKDLGVGHLYERFPCAAKVAFRDGTPEDSPERLGSRVLDRAADAFVTSLRRTDLFERVHKGTGEFAEIGFEATVTRLECRQNYAFVWAFYSAFALIAFPANLPLSIDSADYELTMKAIHVPTGQKIGTYAAGVHLRSWRGAWSLFETFLEDPGQVFDKANRILLDKIVDDYPLYRAAVLRPGRVSEESR